MRAEPSAPNPGASVPQAGTPFEDLPGWTRVSPALRPVRELEVGASAVVVLLVVAAISAASGSAAAVAGSAAVVLVGWGLVAAYMWRRVASWGYLEREQDLLVRRGVMFRRLTVVPYGRMQTVDVSAGPLERVFGLATVRLHTASAASDARVPGLASGDAAALRDRLAMLGKTRAEGL